MSKRQITLWVTDEEYEQIQRMAEASRRNRSDYIRGLLREDAAQRGMAWPEKRLDDTRGKYQRWTAQECDEKAQEYLARANEAFESGNPERAAFYERMSGVWLDRLSKVKGKA
jgi:Arc/MetJ-type ribon-helix-helix transcriptional regulator